MPSVKLVALRDRTLSRRDTISTSRRAKSPYMVWVWAVTTAFVVATFITVKLRGYKRCRMHCGTPLPQMRFLACFFSYAAFSDRLSALYLRLSGASVTLATAATPTTKAPRMAVATNVSPDL